MNNKLLGNADYFPSEEHQVSFAYQCLSGPAADRLRSHFRYLYDPTAPREIVTIQAFCDLLNRYFKDPAARQKADTTLATLSQRGMPFHEFITIFEDTLADSTYADLDRATWLALLTPRLSNELYQAYTNGEPPKTYEAFVNWLRNKDALVQARRASQFTSQGPRRPGPPASAAAAAIAPNLAFAPRPPFVPRPAPYAALTTSQGGSRMDIDTDAAANQKGPDGRLTEAAKDIRRRLGNCLRCNQPGHFATSCPLGQRLRAASPDPQAPTYSLKE